MSEVEAADLNGASGHSIPQEMLPSDAQLEEDARERAAEEERRKNREPPIVFKDIDVSVWVGWTVDTTDSNNELNSTGCH